MRSAWDNDRTQRPPKLSPSPKPVDAPHSSSSVDEGLPYGHGQQSRLPTLTPLRSQIDHLRYDDLEQPRRHRSISEVTGTVSHSASSDIRTGSLMSGHNDETRRLPSIGAADSRLPPLSRLSANIRRSNTISALISSPSSSTPYRSQFSPRFPGSHSSSGLADRTLFSPTRIFSRQFPDASDNVSSIQASLPSPLATTSLSASTSGLPMIVSPSSSSTSRLASSGDRATSLESMTPADSSDTSPRKQAKAHVASACLNCKKAHLACDVSRPCRRCVNLGKVDTCIDIRHKKRGRPRLRERELSLQNAENSEMPRNPEAQFPSTSLELASSQRHSQFLHGQQHRSYRPSYDEAMYQPSRAYGRSEQYSTDLHASRMMSSQHEGLTPSIGRLANDDSGYAGRIRSFSAANPPTWHRNSNDFANVLSPPKASDQVFDNPPRTRPVVSFILSTSLHCVRCSEECLLVLGFAPRDLTDISFFELVHPIDEHRVERLWTSLIAPVGIRAQAMLHYRNAIMSLSPAGLVMPAAGTVFLQEDKIRLRTRSGSYESFSVRLHLGAGLGADLFRDDTLERAYIVASVVRHSGSTPPKSLQVGVGASGGGGGGGGGIEYEGHHPDPDLLRQARWHDGLDSRQFTSPSAPFSHSTSSSAHGTSSRSIGKHSNVDVSHTSTPSMLVC